MGLFWREREKYTKLKESLLEHHCKAFFFAKKKNLPQLSVQAVPSGGGGRGRKR